MTNHQRFLSSVDYRIALILAGTASLTLISVARADSLVIDSFDDETSASAWSATWGSTPVLEWSAEDSKGNAKSGSLKVTADYFTPEDNGWEQMVITRSYDPAVIGSEYASVSVDVKIDPSSVPTLGGQYGYFEFKRPDATAMGGVNLTSTNWTTITFPIAPTEGSLTGIVIQNGNGGFQGPITYYLDNLVFNAATNSSTPKLEIKADKLPGLKLYASAPGQAYQRQNVIYKPSEDLANEIWWAHQTVPVTYSVTWGSFPDKASDAGFQGHIILSVDSAGDTSPDWTDANVVMVEFQYANTAGVDGTINTADDVVMARARLLHKVNEPGANGMLYRTEANASAGPVGVLGEILAPSMIGTWSVTFKDDTHITLIAPDNSTKELVMPTSDAEAYLPSTKGVSALFGIQPNSDSRIGLPATISQIKISKGNTVLVDDSFKVSPLDSEKWLIRAQDSTGVFSVPTDLAYILSWNLPDTGFVLRSAPRLNGPWITRPDAVQVGARRMVLVRRADLPDVASGFYQLLKQ